MVRENVTPPCAAKRFPTPWFLHASLDRYRVPFRSLCWDLPSHLARGEQTSD